ncbi:hypothetical protein AB5J62_13040 [Amycolatopsis sp. cg5]|uniref:hypothetical protein n=1 Tax=Amycolatopsis sp. cg5 TaxID=3238802 RepID=UPI00352688FB
MFAIRKTGMAAAGLAVIVAAALIPAAASAEDTPTTRELFDQCNQGRTDLCVFHPTGPAQKYRAPYELVGKSKNCTKNNSTRVIRWESTAGTKTSVGEEISVTVKAGEIFEASYKQSFGEEWSWVKTKADEVRQDIGPHQAVNIYAAPMRTKVKGKFEMHFGSRYYGHYIWYTPEIEVDGPSSDPVWVTRANQVHATC